MYSFVLGVYPISPFRVVLSRQGTNDSQIREPGDTSAGSDKTIISTSVTISLLASGGESARQSEEVVKVSLHYVGE